MTNVFTRKYKHPRTTTLLDFRDIDVRDTPQLRVLSPTRLGNPHPIGLNHQNIPSTSSYLIWHPDMPRKAQRYPAMTRHIGHVNFSCKHPPQFDYVRNTGHPDIRYTETTISRESYINPTRFPALAPDYSMGRIVGRPDKKAVTGIVPNLIVRDYLPVIEK